MTKQITIGGDLTVNRLGFGAMRLTGAPNWPDHADAVKTARRAVELGVTFIDTADAYDLGLNEELLADALHPYGDVVIATKAGQCQPGTDWIPCGRPEYLRQQCELSLRRLKLDRIDLFQLHRVDPLVPLADQIGALRRLQDEGKVRHVGLSEVTVEQIVEAGRITPIASVQNRYNLADRASEDVLEHCESHGIAFIPWLPIKRNVAAAGGIARRIGATEAQVALAWLLRRSPVMVPIPGTSSIAHLEENCKEVELSEEDYVVLTAAA
ncbi:aldo/keto reductase [Fodinicola acaciae]|uniref:aldo/keto reductase n=1 Tax=Fodinicola acaciae TaxID=2681555 RepID=UPI0013D4A936|nr:aldo/keto reductase [Fodinicola acaciae]